MRYRHTQTHIMYSENANFFCNETIVSHNVWKNMLLNFTYSQEAFHIITADVINFYALLYCHY